MAPPLPGRGTAGAALRPGPRRGLPGRQRRALGPKWLSSQVRHYVRAADLGKSGSCHLFRHSAATLMVERGADIRYVQELLGHRDLGSTTVYTRVAPERLAAIHAATHPGAVLGDGHEHVEGTTDE